MLVEGFLGNAEGVYRRRHPPVEDHLRDDFRDFLLGDADMQCAGDMAFNHLGAVAQHHQRGNGTEAAGFQVNAWAVVNLAVDYRIHQPHNVGRQLDHGRRGLRVVVRPVVAHSEVGGGLFKVNGLYLIAFVTLIVQPVFQVGLIGTQVRVVTVEVGGHWNALTLTLSQRERGFWDFYKICQ